MGSIDGDAQYVIDELDGFIEFDWPLAQANPEAPASQLAAAIESRSPLGAIHAIEAVIAEGDIPADVVEVLERVSRLMDDLTPEVIDDMLVVGKYGGPAGTVKVKTVNDVLQEHKRLQNEFFGWALHRKVMTEAHRDISVRRAMTLTSAFIDDHRIRSQFQR